MHCAHFVCVCLHLTNHIYNFRHPHIFVLSTDFVSVVFKRVLKGGGWASGWPQPMYCTLGYMNVHPSRVHGICTLEYPESFNGYSLVSEHIMGQVYIYIALLCETINTIYSWDIPLHVLLGTQTTATSSLWLQLWLPSPLCEQLRRVVSLRPQPKLDNQIWLLYGAQENLCTCA